MKGSNPAVTLSARDVENLENTSFAVLTTSIQEVVAGEDTLAFCGTFPVICGLVTGAGPFSHYPELCGISNLCATFECDTVSLCTMTLDPHLCNYSGVLE